MRLALGGLVALALALMPAPAHAARHCDEPAPGPRGWERATPGEAGMDATKLADAMSYGTSQASYAIRVYRYGCLVAEDAFAPANTDAQYESWSLAKSITSMVFGRAMTKGLITPDDPLGSLITEADAAHGAIRMHDLLTMTSGLYWNGFRDYDILMPDRVRDALLTPVDKKPGTYWEYSQSGPALVAEATQRAIGEDFQAFAQRELFGPIGITPGSWKWNRDSAGHTQGFFGVQMVPDDFAKLGELMRRGGVWNGRRLLSRRYLREALTPVRQSGCYGYLIWLNAARPCVGVRISERPVHDRRMFPGLPGDLYTFSGLFGQLVTVFPSQGIIVQRNGQDPGTLAGGANWEAELYRRVLGSITDTPVKPSGDAPSSADPDRSDPDRGFQTSFEPDVLAPVTDTELPPAGPARSRAVALTATARSGRILARLACPPRLGTGRCAGTAKAAGRSRAFDLAPGARRTLRFRARRRGRHVVRAKVRDAAGGTVTRATVRVRRARVR
jgi:CubicO group peptidase (beta-lactamase class C family)